MSTTPPERIELDELVIRRETRDDAEAIARAIADNLLRLAEWMDWAVPEAADMTVQQARIADAEVQWNSSSTYDYVVISTSDDVVGKTGLHRRAADVVEIGYWVSENFESRGIATRITSTLTELASTLDGVRRVEIRCDEANVRSQAIPRRLGYRLDRVIDHPITTPSQTGRQMIWIYDAN